MSYIYIYVRNNCFESSFDIVIMVIVSLTLLVLLVFTAENNDRNRSEVCNKKLTYKKEKDLDRLLEYIKSSNIIGINGIWGSGKSFLVNKLKDKLYDKYEVVEIDVLSCNLNELQLIIIREIEKIIHKFGIFSRYSSRLQKFLSNQKSISQLINIAFNQDYVYSDIIKGFQNEINRIGKKIIIIYEDIDRITDKKIIENIFGISEKISNDNIKILYQYEKDKLKSIGFDYEYLEKYIPYEINLTEMGFFEIIKFLFEGKQVYNNLNISDFDFLKDYNQKYRYNILSKEFGINNEIYFDLSKISSSTSSFRRVENYLNELNVIFKSSNYKDDREIVIGFLFVKYFIHEIYEKININETILETLNFEIDSKLYTMEELISNFKLQKISKDIIGDAFKNSPNNNNVINYCVLKLFDYNMTANFQSNDLNERRENIEQEPVKKIQDRFQNEKKDEIIWRLLENGKSGYTDYEYVTNRVIKEVLQKPNSERVSEFNKFYNHISHQDKDEIDNGTIFLMFVPTFIELFKAFRILNVKNKYRIRLIDLYFDFYGIQNINNELIKILNYCNINESTYFHLITKFNKLGIIGNLNKEKSFSNFLKKYVTALTELGYIYTGKYFQVISGELVSENKELVLMNMGEIIKDLSELKDNIMCNIGIRGIKIGRKLEKIINFFHIIIKLINCEKEIKSEKDIFKIEVNPLKVIKDEIKRLESILGMNFNKEIIKSYSENKISLYEMNILINKIKDYRKKFILLIRKYKSIKQDKNNR